MELGRSTFAIEIESWIEADHPLRAVKKRVDVILRSVWPKLTKDLLGDRSTQRPAADAAQGAAAAVALFDPVGAPTRGGYPGQPVVPVVPGSATARAAVG
jgi:hypothetical protein